MTTAEARALHHGAGHLGIVLAPDAVDRIARFLDLLAIWSRRLRLTAERDSITIIRKHVTDSLAIVPHLPSVGPVIDLGSGAGFPGIIVGCVRSALEIALVEPRRARASFLKDALRCVGLGASASVVDVSAEEAARADRPGTLRGRGRLVVARGLRLDLTLEAAGPLLAPDGIVLAMQTPSTATGASERARDHGLELNDVRSYTLLGGESRRLLLFSFARGVS